MTLKTDLQLLISIKSTLYASPFLHYVDDDDWGFDDADNNRHVDDSDHDDHYAAH